MRVLIITETIVGPHKLGYLNLYGTDLNPRLKEMLHHQSIRYEVSNFLHAPFAAQSFSAVISTSVIEHGFDGHALLSEVTRLVKPGGFFVASFDYLPEKINTAGIEMFQMSWTIFSKKDVLDFIELASRYGFHPVGNQDFDAGDAPINCAGRRYTFAWLALEKTTAT